MKNLILHPTSTAQWHALIHEAQASSHIILTEDLESYLVFLLIRFTSQPKLSNSVLAIDFLNGFNLSSRHSCHNLQSVGDKCLLFSGLFPGIAEKRLVHARYFVDVGQTAYDTLALSSQTNQAKLFSELATHFIPMKDILHETRTMLNTQSTFANNIEIAATSTLGNVTKFH